MESIYENADTERALVIAAAAHEGQVRKYTGEAYITHPMAVAETLLEYGIEDPEMHAAALLHDVVEDTEMTIEDVRAEFEGVTIRVRWLTKLELPGVPRAKRKQIEALRLAKAGAAVQTIKYADLLHNMKSIVVHDPKFAKVFLREARVLCDVMEDGDPDLRASLNDDLEFYEVSRSWSRKNPEGGNERGEERDER
jgi:(p)ppGpp synthase/HD superfamily hydrolase